MRNSVWLALTVSIFGCDSRASVSTVADAGGDVSASDAGDDADAAPATGNAAPPRPVAPISVSRLTSRRPTFRWKLAAGSDGARVEVFADRACTRQLATFDASGDHGAAPQELPPGIVFWRLRGTSNGIPGATTSATWQAFVPARSAPIATAWGSLLDANGDGFADVVVGDSNPFTATQHVYVHLGGPAGPAPTPSSVLTAPMAVARYSSAISSAGDVDGDGFSDLLVGSPDEDTVYVYRGGPAGFAEPPAAVLHGPTMSGFGAAVSTAGDVDGDGYADVVIGMPSLATAAGVDGGAGSDGGDAGGGGDAGSAPSVVGGATVLFGGPQGLSMSRAAALAAPGVTTQAFGAFVATAGDVDGDGLGDVAVWAGVESSDPLQVALYLGRDEPFGGKPSVLLQYEGASVSWLGNAVLLACPGDVNGDGYTDVMMTTVADPTIRYVIDHVSLFYGGPSGPAERPSARITTPLASTDVFGLSVAATDFDGDGVVDIGVSVASHANPHATALVYRQTTAGPALVGELDTTDTAIEYTREIASPGDIDGDGFADWVVGFPARTTAIADAGDDAGYLSGAVEVHRGGPAGSLAGPRWTLLPPDTTAAAYGATIATP